MNKFLILPVSLVLILISINYAHALTMRPPTITIECSIQDEIFQQNATCIDEACEIKISKDSNGNLHVNSPEMSETINIGDGKLYLYIYVIENPEHLRVFSSVINFICSEDTTGIETWLSENDLSMYSLTFKPYSREIETSLIKGKNNLLKCRYDYFERINNWLAITVKTRNYCFARMRWDRGLPVSSISHVTFFGFLLTNPNSTAFPYLIGYLFVILLIIILFAYLFKRNDAKVFFKPCKFNITLTFILTIITAFHSIFIPTLEEIVIAFVGYYIITSLIVYVYRRLKKEKSTAIL